MSYDNYGYPGTLLDRLKAALTSQAVPGMPSTYRDAPEAAIPGNFVNPAPPSPGMIDRFRSFLPGGGAAAAAPQQGPPMSAAPGPQLQLGGAPGLASLAAAAQGADISPDPFGNGQSMAQSGYGVFQSPGAQPETPQYAPPTAPAAAPAVGNPTPVSLNPAADSAAPQTVAHVQRMEASPSVQYAPLKSTAPDIWDNLLRFGAATMAAGGKPGATTLGALGEGAVSAIDQARAAATDAQKLELENRKVANAAQEHISNAYARADALDVRASTAAMASADRQALHAQAAAMRQQAIDNAVQQTGISREKAEELARQNSIANAQRADTQADRNARNADLAYATNQKAVAAGMIGAKPEEQDLVATARTAKAHPDSVYAQNWAPLKADMIAAAKANIAKGAPQAAVIDKLRPYGITARDLQ